jgi:acetylornithine/N-succinyldiaminopimelate aminotransferase
VQEASRGLQQKLGAVQDAAPHIFEDVRGTGLMLGMKCKPPVADVVAAARAEKLLLVGAGQNVVRLLPPLIVSDAEIDEAVEALSAAARKL